MASEEITTELQRDMANLKADLGSLMTAVKDLGLEQSRAAYGRLRETGEQARVQVRTAQDNIENYVESRPLTSVLIAFGTGFAIGSLLGNRR
jgi:ElaB/YqjD/DUF883 family membrane-anchored ribosome-binding protein